MNLISASCAALCETENEQFIENNLENVKFVLLLSDKLIYLFIMVEFNLLWQKLSLYMNLYFCANQGFYLEINKLNSV